MKSIIILLLCLVGHTMSTFDFIAHMPIPTIVTADTVSTTAPVTDIIDTLFDLANDTLADGSTSGFGDYDVDEEVTTPSSTQPDSICLSHRYVTVIRWLQQRLNKLANAAIEMVSVPLEMIRVAVTAVIGTIGDKAFHLYGYDVPECRHRTICEVAAFFSKYLPQTVLSLFERNWDRMVGIGSRLKVVDLENEYFQAAVIGAFEANCTSFEDRKCQNSVRK